MSRTYQPDLVDQGAPPFVQNGKQMPRFLGAGPCGDVHVWEDRTVNNAVWCSPLIIEGTALLEVTGSLEVIDHVQD